MSIVRFERLSKNASIPTKSTPGSAGFDLFAAYNATVPRYNSCFILTDLSLKMPVGVYGRLTARPGIAVMYNIFVNAEVIDPDNRGNVGVFLHNHGDVDFNIKKGDRICQIIFERYLENAYLLEDRVMIKKVDKEIQTMDGEDQKDKTPIGLKPEHIDCLCLKHTY